jgi:hypothetical protein
MRLFTIHSILAASDFSDEEHPDRNEENDRDKPRQCIANQMTLNDTFEFDVVLRENFSKIRGIYKLTGSAG